MFRRIKPEWMEILEYGLTILLVAIVIIIVINVLGPPLANWLCSVTGKCIYI